MTGTEAFKLDYSRLLDGLESRWQARLVLAARDHVGRALDDGAESHDELDEARWAVERVMFDSADWEPITAVDISDIAYDHVTGAWYALRDEAWKEEMGL